MVFEYLFSTIFLAEFSPILKINKLFKNSILNATGFSFHTQKLKILSF
jgi:hypothetical protein